jgi:hypothetical protein
MITPIAGPRRSGAIARSYRLLVYFYRFDSRKTSTRPNFILRRAEALLDRAAPCATSPSDFSNGAIPKRRVIAYSLLLVAGIGLLQLVFVYDFSAMISTLTTIFLAHFNMEWPSFVQAV